MFSFYWVSLLSKHICYLKSNFCANLILTEKERRTKIWYNTEEVTQFILNLPSGSDISDLDDLCGDDDVNGFNEDKNTFVCNEDPKHHSDTEKSFLYIEILCYPIMIVS